LTPSNEALSVAARMIAVGEQTSISSFNQSHSPSFWRAHMTTNRLAKAAEPLDDRSKWTLHEHCEYANAQIILKGINDERRMKGLFPVKWVIRDNRVVIDRAT
jgi:hypothetical protein